MADSQKTVSEGDNVNEDNTIENNCDACDRDFEYFTDENTLHEALEGE